MAKTYNTLSTVSAGSVLTATAYNEAVENSNNYRVPPMCQVRRTSNTSYTSNTAITWQDAAWDTDSMWDGGDPTKITIGTAGLYVVSFNGYLTASSGGSPIPRPHVLINGNAALSAVFYLLGTDTNYWTLSGVLSLSASDYLTAAVAIQGGSGTFTVYGGTTQGHSHTRLSATWIGQVS